MSTDLQVAESNGPLVPVVANPFDEQFTQIASATAFLPRLQLFIGNSELVKEGKFPMNCYGLVTGRDDPIDLGKEVDVLILAWRPRAIDTSDRENIRASSQVKSELFLEIVDRHDNTKNSGCMYGPEFLLYIPKADSYATVLFGSKTSRNEAPKVKPLIGKPATFKSRFIKTNEYSWQAMVVTPCSTPFKIPPHSEMMPIMTEFLNPKEVTGAEKVEEQTARAR